MDRTWKCPTSYGHIPEYSLVPVPFQRGLGSSCLLEAHLGWGRDRHHQHAFLGFPRIPLCPMSASESIVIALPETFLLRTPGWQRPLLNRAKAYTATPRHRLLQTLPSYTQTSHLSSELSSGTQGLPSVPSIPHTKGVQ